MDLAAFIVGWFIGIVIVLVGWFVAAGLVVLFVHRRTERLVAEHPDEAAQPPDSALLFYALGVFFWPAAFVCGAWLMKKAATVRQGRNCVYIGLADLSVITVATCVAMAILAIVAPQYLQ